MRFARHAASGPTRCFCFCFCFCLLQIVPSASIAQDPTLSERERAAKAAFEAGVQAAQAHDYARARVLFLRSRELAVRASTLLNLALADLKLGLFDEALFALDAIETPSSPEQERLRERARDVKAQIEQARREVAAEDSASPPPPEAPPAVGVAASRELPLSSVALAIARVAEPKREAAVRSRSPPRSPTPADTPANARLAGPRALLVAAGLLGGAAIGTAIWWADRGDAAEACRPGGGAVCAEYRQIAREYDAAVASTIALGVSAIGLLAGGAVWLAHRKRDHRAASVTPWGTRAAFGLQLRAHY